MKKILSVALATIAAISASAQMTYPDAVNKDINRHSMRYSRGARTEIVLPQVNGYNIYKADLHTHSAFSDGSVLPEYRVKEAWVDGLDVMAVTEHIEYRRQESKMLEYLQDYAKKGEEIDNWDIINKPADKKGIRVDLNYAVTLSQKAAEQYGLLIIPGTEITRNPQQIGHYNALFTTDNNAIYDADPLQSFRNAKAQGALIQHNHPGWQRKSIDMPEFEVKAYAEGLIDGIEIMNGSDFYPGAIDRAKELGLFMSANTDIHGTTAMDYANVEVGRNMTLIFAKEKTLEAMREALEARRTLAYAFGNVAGDEQLLKDFFLACVKFEPVMKDYKNRQIFTITNTSSMPFAFRIGGGNVVWLDPFSTISAKTNNIKITVENMWYGVDKHPVLEINL
jgi:predicted metal-dependent phosphoesterase TrpH